MKCKGSHRSRHHFKAIGDVSTCRIRELNYRRHKGVLISRVLADDSNSSLFDECTLLSILLVLQHD